MADGSITNKVGNSLGHAAGKEAVTQAVIGATGGMAAGVGAGSLFGPIGVGIAGAASVLINQAGYQRGRARLREIYKYEVAAQLNKSPERINDRDINLVAKGDKEHGIAGNKTISEELRHLKTRRNLGVLISTVSILGTLAIIVSMPGIGAAAAVGAGANAGIVSFAAKAFAGIAVHALLEKPLTWAGKKIFGMDDVTVHGRISELRRDYRNGKVLGREQVLSVFVSANKELDKFVKDEYGKSYDKLRVQEKQLVADAFEKHIPLTDITENLNSGRVKISELAFSVEGQTSGVAPDSAPTAMNIVGKTRSALRRVGGNLKKSSNLSKDDQTDVEPPPMALSLPKRVIMEYDNPTPSRSFVDREADRRAAAPSRVLH